MFTFSRFLQYAVSWLPQGFQWWFILLAAFMMALLIFKIIMFILDLKFW